MKTSMQSTNKPRPPVPSSMDVCDLGGGSGPPRLHTGGAKNLWVKKNHHTRGERLKIATYNVRTLLKDEHVQELEDELKENNMKWDVIGLGEVRRKEESFTTLQSGHLLYHSEANNGQAGVGFLINKKWKDNITRVSSGSSRVAELILRITDRYQLKIVQVYAPTTSHSDEETDNFYNTIDKILEKQTHYTIVMGDFNAKVGGQTNTSERATGCFGLGQRNERGDTLVEWATSKNFKIMNTQFQKKAGRRWTWRSPDGNTKKRNWLHHDWQTEHGYRRDCHKPRQHWKWPQDGNGLHYAKHQSGKEEASKQEYTNKSWHSNDWNKEEHVSTRTKKQVHSTRRTWRHGQSK